MALKPVLAESGMRWLKRYLCKQKWKTEKVSIKHFQRTAKHSTTINTTYRSTIDLISSAPDCE